MSLFIGKYYTISEASKYVNADLSTLRRWEYEGRVKPLRTAGNQRCYTQPCLYPHKIRHPAKTKLLRIIKQIC